MLTAVDNCAMTESLQNHKPTASQPELDFLYRVGLFCAMFHLFCIRLISGKHILMFVR